jgi:hypothetical protein
MYRFFMSITAVAIVMVATAVYFMLDIGVIIITFFIKSAAQTFYRNQYPYSTGQPI